MHIGYASNRELIESLKKEGILKSASLARAFEKIDRKEPLPIGFEQTISQPLTVAFMLELLEPARGHRVLEIGYGSGWQTAILAEVAKGDSPPGRDKSPLWPATPTRKQGGRGEGGKVFAIERVPELCEYGKANIGKYGFVSDGVVVCICGDGTKGLPAEAPFDRIIAAASAQEMPEEWMSELAVGGRLVVPIRSSVWLFEKTREGEMQRKEFPGFIFVPLIANTP